mmetsp:Transcript_4372/g.13215  ORF Transcript_4372/g.13215 Transcript_4372/m.13215 type:complete len:181 (+) Transcript_4372:217-759(+)
MHDKSGSGFSPRKLRTTALDSTSRMCSIGTALTRSSIVQESRSTLDKGNDCIGATLKRLAVQAGGRLHNDERSTHRASSLKIRGPASSAASHRRYTRHIAPSRSAKAVHMLSTAMTPTLLKLDNGSGLDHLVSSGRDSDAGAAEGLDLRARRVSERVGLHLQALDRKLLRTTDNLVELEL